MWHVRNGDVSSLSHMNVFKSLGFHVAHYMDKTNHHKQFKSSTKTNQIPGHHKLWLLPTACLQLIYTCMRKLYANLPIAPCPDLKKFLVSLFFLHWLPTFLHDPQWNAYERSTLCMLPCITHNLCLDLDASLYITCKIFLIEMNVKRAAKSLIHHGPESSIGTITSPFP